MLIGAKTQLLTLLDNEQSTKASLVPLYSIDILLSKSPTLGVKCGAISIFRLNKVASDFESKLKDTGSVDPRHVQAKAEELEAELNSQTEIMERDPILFRETDGRWITWAIDTALQHFDRVGGSAKVSLKCPKLRIKVVRSPSEVAKLRGEPEALFPVIRDIDRLLSADFSFDPWRKVVRRGRIGADMAKR